MAEAAFTWTSGGRLVAAVVPRSGETIVGRAPDVAIMVDDAAVSRHQARIRAADGSYLIENLSSTNPTRLHDAVPESPVPLMDGDSVKVGKTELTFHHLAAGDRVVGPICSHCARENNASDRDCWFCGTSLVNAPSGVRSRREVVARLVTEEGGATDLLAGESADIGADGAVAVASGSNSSGGVRIEAGDGGLVARPAEPGAAMVAGVPVTDGQVLSTGDVISCGGVDVLVVAR